MQVKIKQKLIYKVKKDDTLSSICSKFKVVESDLLQLNQITQIQLNMVLILPKSYNKIYVVKPLDNYLTIAQNLNISVEKVKEITKGKKMFIGQRIYL